jgi:hypothetical protein
MARLRSALTVVAISSIFLLPASAFARGGGRGGGGRGMQPPAQPQKQPNPTLVADRQAVTDTQKALDAAKAAYNTKLAELQKEQRKSPEYVAAKKAMDEAQKAQDAARTALLAKLKSSDAEYKAAVAKEADSAKKLEQIRATATRDQIAAQAKVKLDAGTAIEKLEKTALDADPAHTEAKKAVAEAKSKLDAVDATIAETLAKDETLKNLKQTMTSAQTAWEDAKKKLEQDTRTLPAMI